MRVRAGWPPAIVTGPVMAAQEPPAYKQYIIVLIKTIISIKNIVEFFLISPSLGLQFLLCRWPWAGPHGRTYPRCKIYSRAWFRCLEFTSSWYPYRLVRTEWSSASISKKHLGKHDMSAAFRRHFSWGLSKTGRLNHFCLIHSMCCLTKNNSFRTSTSLRKISTGPNGNTDITQYR